MKAGADDYQRKQELTREKLITSVRDLTANTSERTLFARARRAHGRPVARRARMQIPGIKVLHLIGEGGMSRASISPRGEGDDEPLVVKILRHEVIVGPQCPGAVSWRSTRWSSASRAGTSRASTPTAPQMAMPTW